MLAREATVVVKDEDSWPSASSRKYKVPRLLPAPNRDHFALESCFFKTACKVKLRCGSGASIHCTEKIWRTNNKKITVADGRLHST
jgi:hypothetical protein